MGSPIFPNFNNRTKALDAFRKSQFGKQVGNLSRKYRGREIPQTELSNLARQFGEAVNGDVMRYGAKTFWNALTTKLGPIGHLIESLIRPNGKSLAEPDNEIRAAKELLESFGWDVSQRQLVEEPPGSRTPLRSEQLPSRPAGEYISPTLPQRSSKSLQEKPEEPHDLFEGMIPVRSSNVHSIGYEWGNRGATGNLMVRFLGGTGKARSGPGALYRYIGVPRAVFVAFKMASSKGKFVWDELRIRGTISGHQYPYELAGTDSAGYIPRQAGLKRGFTGEWYLRRSYMGRPSNLPEAPVRRPAQAMTNFQKNRQLILKAGRRP